MFGLSYLLWGGLRTAGIQKHCLSRGIPTQQGSKSAVRSGVLLPAAGRLRGAASGSAAPQLWGLLFAVLPDSILETCDVLCCRPAVRQTDLRNSGPNNSLPMDNFLLLLPCHRCHVHTCALLSNGAALGFSVPMRSLQAHCQTWGTFRGGIWRLPSSPPACRGTLTWPPAQRKRSGARPPPARRGAGRLRPLLLLGHAISPTSLCGIDSINKNIKTAS